MAIYRIILAVLILMPICSEAHEESRIGFIENKNQFHPNVAFQARFNHYAVFLEQQRFTFLFEHPEDLAARHDILKASPEEQAAFVMRSHAYRVNFVNSNPGTTLQSDNQHDFLLNYYIGNDTGNWASGARSYRTVKYQELYDGIDLLAVVDGGNLKYDFMVSPGSETNQIKLNFEGLDEMAIDSEGNLVLSTSVGEMKELSPFAYQMINGSLVPVKCNYVLNGSEVQFEFPEGYDEDLPLVIDPVVIASTLSGTPGGGSNYGHGASFDLAGNIYSHAIAFGTQYPVTAGAAQINFGGGSTDIAISKYNSTGTDLIYATYLGGSGSDYPHSTVTNQFEELFVYGTTNSDDYPTTAGSFDPDFNGDGGGGPWGGGSQDIVISKLSADGTVLQGSTYVGGSAADGLNNGNSLNYGDNYRGEIMLDMLGFPYVVSQTNSDDFPVTAGAYQTTHQGNQDAVVFKMTQNLTDMIWSTYLGSAADDTGYGIRPTDNGDVVVCGSTEGADFPTTAGAFQEDLANGDGTLDAFIARLSSDGSQLLISTFVGTSAVDQAFFVDLDNDEDVWIYGQSQGDWPVVGDGNYSTPNGKLYVAKFNPQLDEMLVSSRIGPGTGFNGDAAPVAFLVDRCDRIYICGYSASSGFELTDDALYNTGSFVLCAWEEDMSELAFSTYYGGSHVDGGTSRFDKSGIVYQGVCNGGFFPTNPDAWATGQDVGWDIGVFKIDFELSGVNAAITTNDDINGCAPHEIQFNNYSIGDIYIWNFGDGSPESSEFEPTHTYTEPGEYTISLISYDSLSCNLADTAYLFIEVGSSEAFNPSFSFEVDCETSTVELTNETGAPFLDYEWDMGDGTTYLTDDATHTYEEPGVYNIVLTGTDNACDNTEIAEQEIEIFGSLTAEIENEQVIACQEVEVQFNNLSNGESYLWDFGDGTTSEATNPTHTFIGPGVFEVTLTAFHSETCNPEDETTMTVAVGDEQEVDAAFSVFQTDCENFIVETNNQSVGDYLSFEWDMGDGTTYTDENVTHTYTDMGNYQVTLSIEDTLCLYTNDAEVSINVTNQATAVAELSDMEGCPPLEISFGNNSTGQDFLWDFGDGSTSTEFEPNYTFENSGDYEVMLIVYGSESCPGQDTAYAEVSVANDYVEALFTYQQSGLCADYTADFVNLSQGEDVEYSWMVNETEYSDQEEFSHVFPGTGTYTVSLTATETQCFNQATYTDEVTIVSGFNVFIGPDRDICYYENSVVLDIGTDPDGLSIDWSTGQSNQSSIVVSQPGDYSVEVTDGTCIDESEVTIGQGFEWQGSSSLEICEGIAEQISIPAYSENYQWATGQTTHTISITRAGNYGFSFIDEGGCVQSDTIYVTARMPEATVYIPNSFTPNEDGVNDLFKVVGEEFEDFEILIYNRWGERIFQSNDPNLGWDGSLNNQGEYYLPNGIYPYTMKYKSTCKADIEEVEGHITLLR